MSTSARSSLMLLTGAGLASAVICISAPSNAKQFLIPGAIFGVTIVSYFALFEGYRTPFRFLAFLCACSAAYPLSMWGAFRVGILLQPLMDTSSQSTGIPLFYLFIGGGIGACIVLFSGMLLFGPTRMSREAVGATFVCIFLCGFLALVGGAMDRQLGRANQNSHAAIFVVWQTGVALMLGLLLHWTRETSPRESETTTRSVSVAGGLFLACVLAAFSYFVWSYFAGILRDKHHAALLSQLKAEEPPRAGLERSGPPTDEQLFVLHDIGTLRPLYPQVNSSTTWETSAPTLFVSSIGYGLDQAHSMPSLVRKAFVQVLRLPNVDWARYEVHYIATYAGIDCHQCVSRVTKFGAQITRIAFGDSAVAYLWSNGTAVV